MARKPFLRILAGAFGSTLTIQLLGLLRHTGVAAFYGISRDLDLFTVVNAVATVIVFSMASLFDTLAVPRLTRLHQEQDHDSFQSFAGQVLSVALLFGGGLSGLFLLAMWLLAPVIGAGMTAAEQQRMLTISPFFLLWTLVAVPYYALGSFHKARWQFQRVFNADILIMLVSLGCLLLWHESIFALPLAYGAGYAMGILWLLPGNRLRLRMPYVRQEPTRSFLRNFGEMVSTGLIGNLGSGLERFFQSYLSAGSISSLGYAGLVTSNTASLLLFREIFIVPLSDQQHRGQRLKRLLCALSLLAAPVCGLLALEAELVVTILFKRGKFDTEAVTRTTLALQCLALSLLPLLLTPPVTRMFQVIDKIRLTGWINLASLVLTALAGAVLVLWLRLDLLGYALTSVLASYGCCLVAFTLLWRQGLLERIEHVLGVVFLSLLVSGAGYVLATLMPVFSFGMSQTSLPGLLVAGCVRGGIFLLTVAGLLGCFYRPLRSLLRGGGKA